MHNRHLIAHAIQLRDPHHHLPDFHRTAMAPVPSVPSPPPALEPQSIPSTSAEPTSTPASAPAPALSKNALKKARKAELIAERKLERRAREREKRKEKKRQRSERIAAGEDVSDDDRSKKRAKLSAPKAPFGGRVVVDLGFDDKMSDKVRPPRVIGRDLTLIFWWAGGHLAVLAAGVHL